MMNISEFSKIVAGIKVERPIWFELESDPPGADSDINEAETALCVKLPVEYKEFIRNFGGGHFAFAGVYSVRKGSAWNIVMRNNEINTIDPKAFLAVSDNGAGDFYGFKVIDGVCESKITFYDHEDGVIKSTDYEDLLDFLVRVGLCPA